MASYLVQASYTIQALASPHEESPESHRGDPQATEKLGGKLIGLWLSFGDQDIVCIVDMPNNVSAAAMALAMAAGGAVKSTKTTPMLTVEEGISAMKKAATSGYTPIKTD